MTNRNAFMAGVRAQIPILLGVAPFGMIYGVLAINASLPADAAQAMSSVVFAGSSQFIATSLFAVRAPFMVLVVTTFVVNLRHALYSASVAPYVEHLPVRWKIAVAYLLTDEAYAVGILHYRVYPGGLPTGAAQHFYYFGTALALWTTWQISTAIGIVFGAQVPAEWALDFALPLTFIAIVIPALKDKPSVLAAGVAAVAAVLAYDMPYQLGLIVAAFSGIAAGFIAESRLKVRPKTAPEGGQ